MFTSILDSGCPILDVVCSSRRRFHRLEARATLKENPVSCIEYLLCSRFYSQITRNTNKKSSLRFRQAAFFINRTNCVRSKRPLTCRNLSCRPPPLTSVLPVRLPHDYLIKPTSFKFVKQKLKKFGRPGNDPANHTDRSGIASTARRPCGAWRPYRFSPM